MRTTAVSGPGPEVTPPPAAILLVDDQEPNLSALEAILEPLGHTLVRATSGYEALRHLLLGDFALILLDVQMPGLDGFETARHIKRRSRTRLVPIIFLSAISQEHEHQLQGYASGAVDYLATPFDPTVLRSKVSVFLELHEKGRLIEEQSELLRRRLAERDQAQAALANQAAELARSNADLEQFCAVASHDLQEPLRTTAGFLERLTDHHAGGLDAEGRLLMERAAAGVARMNELVSHLLGYARVGAGPGPASPASASAAVDRAVAALDSALRASGGLVERDDLPTVVADEWQLTQLFENLIGNSLKFHRDEPPVVRIGAEPTEEGWQFRLSDNGIGIDPVQVPRLFTLFQRLHPREAYPGTGIGLAVCKRIVERHGGRIWAESEPGRGSTFLFTLPAG